MWLPEKKESHEVGCKDRTFTQSCIEELITRPRGYKIFFMLNSIEHEILNAHKYKNIKKFGIFYAQINLECYFSRSVMLKCQQLLVF